MSELHSFDTNTTNQISRRSMLKAGMVLGAAYKFPAIAEFGGEVYDTFASPESIIQKPIATLEPRVVSDPVVEPQSYDNSLTVTNRLEQKSDGPLLRFDHSQQLAAEHTGTPVYDSAFQPAGVAVITTAEGPVSGERQYCTLFQGETQTVAIGYEGGLFVYEPKLGSDETQSSGEWVRIVKTADDEHPESPVTTHWVEQETPHNMLIEKVVQGTNTLKALGYRPWAAVLPTTTMPDAGNKELAPEFCAQDVHDAATRPIEGKFFCISERGDLIDLEHMRAKAGETFDLFAQLHYLRLTGDENPIARVRYSQGSQASFEFAVARESLQADNVSDTTFSIMTATTMLMEGVSQRYMTEKMPATQAMEQMSKQEIGGLSAEDPFSNSLGIVGMLSLLREAGFADQIENFLRKNYQSQSSVSSEKTIHFLEETLGSIRDKLAAEVVAQTVDSLGVRAHPQTRTYKLPRGLYPLVPTKITAEDAHTPTRINLRAAGIRADNPQVHFTPVQVPAMQPTIQLILSKMGM